MNVKMRKEVRRPYNKSYRSKSGSDREVFKEAQKAYKKKLKRVGNCSWKKYCSEVDGLSDTARLYRVLRSGAPRHEGPLKMVTGKLAENAPVVQKGCTF